MKPAFWSTTQPLPAAQLHYGIHDTAVIDQGRRFNQVLQAVGKPDFEYYEYDAGHSTFYPEGGARMQQFIEALLD